MPRVIFSITYPIHEDKRADYLETIQALRTYLTAEKGKDYSVFESMTQPNTFNEVYICRTMEEYEALEDDADEVTDQLINRIVEEFVRDKAEYRTLIELA